MLLNFHGVCLETCACSPRFPEAGFCGLLLLWYPCGVCCISSDSSSNSNSPAFIKVLGCLLAGFNRFCCSEWLIHIFPAADAARFQEALPEAKGKVTAAKKAAIKKKVGLVALLILIFIIFLLIAKVLRPLSRLPPYPETLKLHMHDTSKSLGCPA